MSIRSLRHDIAPLSEVNMHYVVAGDGPTVMLLHGWPQFLVQAIRDLCCR